jgi:hypothetical protein
MCKQPQFGAVGSGEVAFQCDTVKEFRAHCKEFRHGEMVRKVLCGDTDLMLIPDKYLAGTPITIPLSLAF